MGWTKKKGLICFLEWEWGEGGGGKLSSKIMWI